MLVYLVQSDTEQDSGLQAYLRNMMNVMEFDVERRGRLISQAELSQYTHWLSKAVTEYMFYFIGHRDPPPQSAVRIMLVGAHVVHMLRDIVGDINLGYFNIPEVVLASDKFRRPCGHPSIRTWVHGQVMAHEYFDSGRKYISKVKISVAVWQD
jgi:hypothetical protein